MSANAVPVIDISPFLAGTPEGKASVAKAVADACTDIGFFAISGHGVPQNIVEDLRESAHSFFEQPEEVKHRFKHPVKDTPRGFRVFQGEALGRTSGGVDAKPDLKEFYHFGREVLPPEDPYFTGPEGKQYFIPNLWPDEPEAFHRSAVAYWNALNQLASKVAHIIAVALDLPETWFDDKIDTHATAVRLNYYPLIEDGPPAGQIRAGEHTDFGMMTILMGEDEPGGLQVRTRRGEWIDVETRPDFFIINIGDLLMRWTNDTWLSNLHRVVNPPEGSKPTRGRLSVGYFFQPNYDALIECIPTCTGPGRPALYEPVYSGRYRDVKYAQGNDIAQRVKA